MDALVCKRFQKTFNKSICFKVKSLGDKVFRIVSIGTLKDNSKIWCYLGSPKKLI